MHDDGAHAAILPLVTRSVLAVVLTVAVLGGAGVAVAAPAATKRCSGTFNAKVNNKRLEVSKIRARAVGCASATSLIKRFLRRADERPGCRRAAAKLPPTRGCEVGIYHCWRRLSTYCAKSSADVSWRETRR